MLEGWHDFFVLLGTAAAALVALLFVAVSVGVGFLSFESAAGTRMYMSPVVVHFTGVLFACAAGLVPGLGAVSCAWIFGTGATAGIVYSVIIAMPVLRNPATDLDDKICHGIVPPISYALGLVAAVMFYARLSHRARRPRHHFRHPARGQYPQCLGPRPIHGAQADRGTAAHESYLTAHSSVTLIFVPPLTLLSVFTSPSALAQTLHGLASRVSSPFEIGVRPKPMAIASPSGQ